MSTLYDLRLQVRQVLASSSDWSDEKLDRYLQDAIRFYSAEFPRLYRYTLSLTTGTQVYDLPGEHGFLGVVMVEYPSGEDPREYLMRVDERANVFRSGGDVYALRGVSDALAIASDTAPGQIVFAEDVTTGESAVIEYLGLHRVPLVRDDDAVITVPHAHWEALIAFVEFRAHWELESDEAVTVTSSSIVLAQLGQSARQAWLRYKDVVDRLRYLQGGRSVVAGWGDDLIGGRVY